LYWPKIDSDSHGRPSFGNPTDTVQIIPCRWEDKQQEIILPDKRKVMARGYLLLGFTSGGVQLPRPTVGGLVFLGTLADWQAQPTYPKIPTVTQGAREILMVETTPDLQAVESLYEVWLL
jgi:hypothetical protein